MCTFKFLYTDGHSVICEHVKTATYMPADMVKVDEQSLTTHEFPLDKPIWLFAESRSYCVSADGLRSITVEIE